MSLVSLTHKRKKITWKSTHERILDCDENSDTEQVRSHLRNLDTIDTGRKRWLDIPISSSWKSFWHLSSPRTRIEKAEEDTRSQNVNSRLGKGLKWNTKTSGGQERSNIIEDTRRNVMLYSVIVTKRDWWRGLPLETYVSCWSAKCLILPNF